MGVGLSAATFCFGQSASAAVVASWNFGTDPSTTTAATTDVSDITASVSRNGTVGYSSASYSLDSNGWQSASTANNVQFSLTDTDGTPYTLSDFDFSAFRSSTGPSEVDVYTSVDGGPLTLFTTTPLAIGTATGSSATNYDLALNQTFSDSYVLDFVADSSGLASGATGTLRLNNPSDSTTTFVQFLGSATAVPEPASASILALVGLTTMSARRRNVVAK